MVYSVRVLCRRLGRNGRSDFRMRILHILSTPRAEGTPNLVLDWLAARPDLVQSVLVLNRDPADLTDRLKGLAADYEEHDLFSLGKRKFSTIAQVSYTACKRRKPDLVVCWPTGFSNWACAGARLAGVRRLIVHAGNPPTRSFRSDWMSRYVMWPLWAMNAYVVCCSEYVRQENVQIPLVPKSLFFAVWNCARVQGVLERSEIARQGRTDRGRPVAIMVATLERHKDHETMLRAMPSILRELPDFQIRFVGDGSLRSRLEALTLDLGVKEHVEFLGTRKDIPEQLGGADIFVLSTTPQEGLGTVIIEALAAGLPVIASNVPACREILQEGRRGRLVAPSDPDQMAKAIIQHFQEKSVSDAGRDARVVYASAFTPDRMIEEYLEIARLP